MNKLPLVELSLNSSSALDKTRSEIRLFGLNTLELTSHEGVFFWGLLELMHFHVSAVNFAFSSQSTRKAILSCPCGAWKRERRWLKHSLFRFYTNLLLNLKHANIMSLSIARSWSFPPTSSQINSQPYQPKLKPQKTITKTNIYSKQKKINAKQKKT